MKMKNVAIIAGLGLVGALVVKKVIDRKKAKIDANFKAREEEKEVVDVECEDVDNDDEWEWEYYDDPEYIVPQQRRVRKNKNGKAVNDNLQGAAKFEGLKGLDKWIEKYERKAIKYLQENPNVIQYIIHGAIALMYKKRYGLKGLVGYAIVVRFVMKYANELCAIVK